MLSFPRRDKLRNVNKSKQFRHNNDRLRPAFPWAKVTHRRVHFADVQCWHFFARKCRTLLRLPFSAGQGRPPAALVSSRPREVVPLPIFAYAVCRSTHILLCRHWMFIGCKACIRREFRVFFSPRVVQLNIMNTLCQKCDLQPSPGLVSSEAFRPATRLLH